MLSKVRQILPSSTPFRLGLALAGLVLLLLLPFAADAALSYNRIHSGITINGQEVGRMTRSESTAVVAGEVRDAADQELTLTAEERDWTVTPEQLGLRIDAPGAVSRAFDLTREGSLADRIGMRFRLYLQTKDVPLEGTVDTSALDDLLAEIGESLDDPATETQLQMTDGEITVVEGEKGEIVDREELRARIKQRLFTLHLNPGEIPIPMMMADPHRSAADTEAAVAQAKVMLSAPVKLKHGEDVWELSEDRIAEYLDFVVEGEGEDSQLTPLISADRAAPFLDEVAAAVRGEPKNATWETDGETAQVVPHEPGFALDNEATAAALTAAARSSANRTAEVMGTKTTPGLTAERARELGVKEKLASYTTHFGGSSNRRANVQRAAELIDDTLLAPGEEFDFNTVVGKRTAANGFKVAPVIIGGRLEDSLGGGICQVSTTLFNAAFFAGLEVTARSNHTLYISHYPTGRDATVSWGGPDMRFRNDTENWILIRSASSPSMVLFVIYGTPEGRKVEYTTSGWYNIRPKVEEKETTSALTPGETKVEDQGQTGRSVTVRRKVTREGTVIHEDTFASNYPMIPKVIKVGPTTTTVPETTTTIPSDPGGAATTTTAPPAGSTTTTLP